ncbi:MAG: penicillin-binding protein, partial [Patescibacteria group bacterium]|nr:penicillin-binding protein [Patescibacteria group bacterium]
MIQKKKEKTKLVKKSQIWSIEKYTIISIRAIRHMLQVTYRLIRIKKALLFLSLRFFIKKLSFHISFIHRPLPKQKIIFQAKQKKSIAFPKIQLFRKYQKKTLLKKKKHERKNLGFFRKLLYVSFGGTFVLFFFVIPLGLYIIISDLPHPSLLKTRDIAVTTKIFDRNGILLYEIYSDENRTPLPLSEIPDIVKQATIAIEDKDFYKHNGFSITGIIRAVREIILHKQLQGGSTITQQLIKSTLLTPNISLERKLKEIFLAHWTEKLFTKAQILEMYLNQVSFGGTAWGIESASQTYFGKSVKTITLAEAAFLAGLLQSPSYYSPFSGNKNRAIERQHEVLRRMVEDGYITQQEADEAKKQELSFISPKIPIRAPHFVWYVKDILEKKYGQIKVEKGGLQVATTLDINLQENIQRIVTSHIKNLSNLQVGNGAALITDPKTGDILAMVGSKDYFDNAQDGNVNVTT